MAILDYTWNQTVAPTLEPLSREDVRKHVELPQAETRHDKQISDLIAAARETLEHDTGLALMTQTWERKLDCFPDTEYITLDKRPLQSISSIQYIDLDGNTQTWGSSNYEVDTAREPPVIWEAYNVDWPSTRTIQNAVTITGVFGYTAPSNVPPMARHAMLLLIGHWFENREAVAGSMSDVPESYHALISRLMRATYP